jgi:hypothetical protein
MGKNKLAIDYAIFGEPKADSAIMQIKLENAGKTDMTITSVCFKTKKSEVDIASARTRFFGELGPDFPFTLAPTEKTAVNYFRKNVVLLLRDTGVSTKHPGKIEIIFTDSENNQHKCRFDTAGL